MNQDVIQVPFGGVAARKLHDLFERGYTVCGVAIQRIHQSGNFDRGAITTGGMVMWWQKLFSGDELEASNVQHPSNALQLAEALHEMANTYLPTGGDFMPAPRSKADELIDEAASELRRQHARIAELEAENKSLRVLASGGIDLFERYSTFKAKCAELEAMLDAVGAGGVGQSIKPQIQADTVIQVSVPTGWKLVPVEPTDDMFIEGMEADCRGRPSIDDDNHVRSIWRAMLSSAPDAPQPPAPQPLEQPPAAQQAPLAGARCKIIDNCKSCQHSAGRQSCMLANRAFEGRERPPTPPDWCPLPLYTAPQPARPLLTEEQIALISVECAASHKHDDIHFARAIEAAVNGGQQ